jgi:TolA-binding protein
LAILDLFSSVVSRPAGRLLEGSVRTLVNDLIRDHDLASAAEVDTLRRSLRQLEGRADDLQGKLDAAEGEVAELRSALKRADERLAEARGALDAANASMATHSHDPAPSAPAQPAAAEPTPVPAAPEAPEGCRVADCTNKHRSKGFCSPHYQRWRRGTLPGFVMPDGTVQVGDKARKLGKKHAGLPYEVVDGKPVLGE